MEKLAKLTGACKTCKFFSRLPTESDQGECRWGPPQVTIVLLPHQDIAGRRGMAPQNFTAWPLVQDEQFCGQWAGRISATLN